METSGTVIHGYELTHQEQFTLEMLQLKQTDGELYDALTGIAKDCSRYPSMKEFVKAIVAFWEHETSKGDGGLKKKDPELHAAAHLVLEKALEWPHLCVVLGALAAVSKERDGQGASKPRRNPA